MPLIKRYRLVRLENARTEVATIGPSAFPANLAEFKKPMTPPFCSPANMDIVNGMVAATSPV